MKTFKEYIIEGFKSDKESMLYANGKESAYRVYIESDKIVFATANGFGDKFEAIKSIDYDLNIVQRNQKIN